MQLLDERFARNVGTVMFAFKMNIGRGGISALAGFGDVAAAPDDAEHPAAVRDELAVFFGRAGVKYQRTISNRVKPFDRDALRR